eukprot:GHVR01163556.1.p1 GENE.GHVR01163556.1~~GHVR01163556.1.p1  ORF type:complete len:102 (+),score=12.44 GHVR01163556.1:3425-3730(+)
MYFKDVGERVFDIKIGSMLILENFDVIKKSGSKYAAHEEYIEIDVQKDGVYFNKLKISQALKNDKLQLFLSKGRKDNPIIQAIIIYNDAIESTIDLIPESS